MDCTASALYKSQSAMDTSLSNIDSAVRDDKDKSVADESLSESEITTPGKRRGRTSSEEAGIAPAPMSTPSLPTIPSLSSSPAQNLEPQLLANTMDTHHPSIGTTSSTPVPGTYGDLRNDPHEDRPRSVKHVDARFELVDSIKRSPASYEQSPPTPSKYPVSRLADQLQSASFTAPRTRSRRGLF